MSNVVSLAGLDETPPGDRGGNSMIVASPKDPMPNARRFAREKYTSAAGEPLLVCQHDDFYAWNGWQWCPVERADLRSQLYERFEGATYLKPVKEGFEETPFEPNRYAIANLVEALEAVTHHPAAGPARLGRRRRPGARQRDRGLPKRLVARAHQAPS